MAMAILVQHISVQQMAIVDIMHIAYRMNNVLVSVNVSAILDISTMEQHFLLVSKMVTEYKQQRKLLYAILILQWCHVISRISVM